MKITPYFGRLVYDSVLEPRSERRHTHSCEVSFLK